MFGWRQLQWMTSYRRICCITFSRTIDYFEITFMAQIKTARLVDRYEHFA
jgi:hypothetical protein